MDEPASLHAPDIREKRADILERLIPFTEENIDTHVHRAQYEGYGATEGVQSDSQTETYFEFKAHIDSEVWRDVPFYVRAGKSLCQEKVSVEIIFHDVATGPFETKALPTVGNKITLSISPEYAMHITLNVKKPGHGFAVVPETLSYVSNTQTTPQINAYEKVLLDCITNDRTLFTSSKEVLASWKFITALQNAWHSVPLQKYAKGSAGPENSFWSRDI
jgi:glucose-6-phosphate 1-dehydrogenase